MKKGRKYYVYKKVNTAWTDGKKLYLTTINNFFKGINLAKNKTIVSYKEKHKCDSMRVVNATSHHVYFASDGEFYGKTSYLYKLSTSNNKIKRIKICVSDFIRDGQYIYYKKAEKSWKRCNLDGTHEKSVSERTWGYAVGAVG